MEEPMDDVPVDVEFYGCSSTTTSSSLPSLNDGMGEIYAWNGLSQVTAELGWLCPDDGAQDLIESMLCDDTADLNLANGSAPKGDCHEKGLRLLHLLIAAAEALSGTQKSPELARAILARLKQMLAHIDSNDNAAAVSNMERLATHFSDALQGLLDGRQVTAAASHVEVLTAFQMLQDMSPYIKFGHFTANQAILEAVAGDRRVHVVDYDIAEGVQWASLMKAMTTTSRPDAVPPTHLRITAVISRGGTRPVQEAGRRLAAFAASMGQPFSFGQCRLDSDDRFRLATVRTVKGETLVANCALNNQATAVRRPTGSASAASFLAGMATLGAKVVTVVEDEDQGDAAEACGGFVARFMEELHRYSAMWDSLEAGFPTQSSVRGLVERAILAPNIAGVVSRAYDDSEAEARAGWVAEWMRGNGFRAVPLSCFNHSQARLLLGLFNDGYTVEQTSPNKIVLGWKARRLLSASVWTPPPPVSPVPGVTDSPTDEAMSPASDGVDRMEDIDYIDSFLVSSPLMR